MTIYYIYVVLHKICSMLWTLYKGAKNFVTLVCTDLAEAGGVDLRRVPVGDLQTQLVALPVTVGAGPGVLAQAEILQHILPRQLGLALRIGQIQNIYRVKCNFSFCDVAFTAERLQLVQEILTRGSWSLTSWHRDVDMTEN